MGSHTLTARAQQTTLDQLSERHTRFGTLRGRDLKRGLVEFADITETPLGDLAIGCFALDPDPGAAEHFRHRASRAGPEKRVEHHVAGVRRAEQNTVKQRLGFLGPFASFNRSWPVQIGSTQSERIWMPSFSAFSAS